MVAAVVVFLSICGLLMFCLGWLIGRAGASADAERVANVNELAAANSAADPPRASAYRERAEGARVASRVIVGK